MQLTQVFLLRKGNSMKTIFVVAAAVVFSCGRCGTVQNFIDSECQIDAHCDDGLYCNGAETCNTTCLRGFPGLGCTVSGPKECRSAINRESTPCCTASKPHTSACESACNESDDNCEMGNECVTDGDCDDGIDCTGQDFCEDGFCYNKSAITVIEGGADNLAVCRDACVASGFARVESFDFGFRAEGQSLPCKCTIEENSLCDFSRHLIKDHDARGCDVVCDEAGWPATQGRDPDRPDFCMCGLADWLPTDNLERCLEWCTDTGNVTVVIFSQGDIHNDADCKCSDGTGTNALIDVDDERDCEESCEQIGFGSHSYDTEFGHCDCRDPLLAPNPIGEASLD